MAITFKSIKRKAGDLFRSFRDSFNRNNSGVRNTATVLNGLDYSNSRENKDKITGGYTPAGASGSWEPSTTSSSSQTNQSSYTPQYGGNVQSGQENLVSEVVRGSGGSSNTGGAKPQPTTTRLTGKAALDYAKNAGLQNLSLEGKTFKEADELINLIKDTQRSQVTANTSAVFSPNTPSNVEKRVKDLELSINETQNNTWDSKLTTKDKVDSMLKSTAKDLAEQFDSVEAIAGAYHSNPVVQSSLDKFARYGGSDQMLIDAVNEKARKTQAPAGSVMTTADYVAQQGNKEQNQIMSGDKIITDEIARVAKIPEGLKDKYFGEEGIWQQRVNLAKENISLLKEKIADEKASAREKARYYMEKNNHDLSLAKSTIEQNRVNAKNYMTGMLAKLGALNTTSAAVEGIATLDQKYQQQAADIEAKVNFANKEIEAGLRDTINDIENSGYDKIMSIKEDLSKDQESITKEIMKVQQDSEKRIYELTLKANKNAEKNIQNYSDSAMSLSEQYITKFNALVSNGFDVNQAGKMASVKLPTADARVANAIRANDPRAIAYFKTLPSKFKNEWIRDVQFSPNPNAIYTLQDLQKAFTLYQQGQGEAGSETTSETTISDEEFLKSLSE